MSQDTMYASEQAQDYLYNGEDLSAHTGAPATGGGAWANMDPADKWAWFYVVGSIALLWGLGGIVFRGLKGVVS